MPKGDCVTLGTYDAKYAARYVRLYCRLEMHVAKEQVSMYVYCLIARKFDYTETRRTQGCESSSLLEEVEPCFEITEY